MLHPLSKRALGPALALVALGCEPVTHVAEIDCRQRDHCDADEVCFQGFCRDPGAASHAVYVDIAPPSNSRFLPQAERVARPLEEHLEQDLTLTAPVTLSGSVRAAGSNRTGLVSFVPTSPTPRLPGLIKAQVDIASEGGFGVNLLPGESYEVSFTPSGTVPRPPRDYGTYVPEPGQSLELPYWNDADLVVAQGELRVSSVNITPVEGATVEGIASAAGGITLRSSVAVSGSDGKFMLAFPPGAEPPFSITAYHNGVPRVTRSLDWSTPPAGGQPGVLQVFDFALTGPAVSFDVTVRDGSGSPVPNARLVFEGQKVGAGLYTAQAQTGVAGSVNVKNLPLGRYMLWVVPPLTASTAVSSRVFCLAPAGLEESTCGDGVIDVGTLPRAHETTPLQVTAQGKIKLQGAITDSNGDPVVKVPLFLIYASPHFRREHTVSTDDNGEYAILIDPGLAGAPLAYQLVVEPALDPTRILPRVVHTVSIDDDPVQEFNVSLPLAALAHGVVSHPDGSPVANVRVAFYSVDIAPATANDPLRLGLGQTNHKGEYVFPIAAPAPPLSP